MLQNRLRILCADKLICLYWNYSQRTGVTATITPQDDEIVESHKQMELKVKSGTDPTQDIDELWAIRRSNEMELDLIDLWLHQLEGSPDRQSIEHHLLELRNLCILRNRLVKSVETEHFVAASA